MRIFSWWDLLPAVLSFFPGTDLCLIKFLLCALRRVWVQSPALSLVKILLSVLLAVMINAFLAQVVAKVLYI